MLHGVLTSCRPDRIISLPQRERSYMAARLVVYKGKLRGKIFNLPIAGRVVLGRSSQASIVIPDANLSRSHCSISATPRGYVLEDLNSTNGTFVNGKRTAKALLREGDRIVMGETEMEFRVKERFDDGETKMDLVPVGNVEEISPSEALQLLRATSDEAASTARPSSAPAGLKRVRFCDICDVTVPRPDLESGAARELAGRLLCAECVGRLSGKNVDAAASLEHVLDELKAELAKGKGMA